MKRMVELGWNHEIHETSPLLSRWNTTVMISTSMHGKNGFVKVTKLGTTNNFFVAATKNFVETTERLVDRTKHFVAVTKYFCYPYFNK